MLSLWQLSITMALMGWKDVWPPPFSLHSHSTQTCKVLSSRSLKMLFNYPASIFASSLCTQAQCLLPFYISASQTNRQKRLSSEKKLKKCSWTKDPCTNFFFFAVLCSMTKIVEYPASASFPLLRCTRNLILSKMHCNWRIHKAREISFYSISITW